MVADVSPMAFLLWNPLASVNTGRFARLYLGLVLFYMPLFWELKKYVVKLLMFKIVIMPLSKHFFFILISKAIVKEQWALRINCNVSEMLLRCLKILLELLLGSLFLFCFVLFCFLTYHVASKNCVKSGRQKPKQRDQAINTHLYGMLLHIKIQICFIHFFYHAV